MHPLPRRSSLVLRALLLWGGLLATQSSHAASLSREFWPELNAYVAIDERRRLMFSAAATHASEGSVDDGRPSLQDAQFTANFDYTLAPILRRDVPQAEWSKNRLLWARLGFEYGSSFSSGSDSLRSYTGIVELSSRLPLEGTLWLTSRARVDLRDISGQSSQRYRLRVGAEWKEVAFDHPFEPYTSVEALYDTRYDRWSRLLLKAGLETPIAADWRVEPYLALQLDKPADQTKRVLGLGLTFKVYFD